MEYTDFEPTLLHWEEENGGPPAEEEFNLPGNASSGVSTDTSGSTTSNPVHPPPPVPNPLVEQLTNQKLVMSAESLQAGGHSNHDHQDQHQQSQSETVTPGAATSHNNTSSISLDSSLQQDQTNSTTTTTSNVFHPSILNPHFLFTQGILPWDPSQVVANQQSQAIANQVLESLGSSISSSQQQHQQQHQQQSYHNITMTTGEGSAVQVCETNTPAPVPSRGPNNNNNNNDNNITGTSSTNHFQTAQSQVYPWVVQQQQQQAAAANTCNSIAPTTDMNSNNLANVSVNVPSNINPTSLTPLPTNFLPIDKAPPPPPPSTHSPTIVIPGITPSTSSTGNNNNNNNTAVKTKTGSSRTKGGTTRKSKKRKATSNTAQRKNKSSDKTPPFYLFDAPCELRHNFLRAQQKYNMEPKEPDSNAYHYGMAVKGFHPQVNAQGNPILPTSTTTVGVGSLGSGATLNGKPVRLLDARNKNTSKTGNERNEREQQRAQKITELIEKLRLTMVHGGWKSEMKSKYQTLSTCAEYVAHLKQINKGKEALVEKAKSDLEALQRSSDFESVTSSLTEEPTRGMDKGQQVSVTTSDEDCSPRNQNGGGVEHKGSECEMYSRVHQKHRGEKDTVDSEESALCTSSNESGNSSGGAMNISLDKMSSNLSDLTDSNKGSSSDGKGSTGSSDGKGSTGSSDGKASTDTKESSTTNQHSTGNENKSSSTSVSSTAVVVSGIESKSFRNGHADVVVKDRSANARRRKAKRRNACTSLDEDFVLNYEEVFLTSNIPQIIATPAGRIVSCNKFFHSLTGLTEEDVKRITIFSIVQSDKLSSLFELVSEALRDEKGEMIDTCEESSKSVTTVTLPCVSFPKQMKDLGSLFMHVSLMPDADPMKRCIHCVFTDTTVTNGEICCISQELLSTIFSVKALSDITDNISESHQS